MSSQKPSTRALPPHAEQGNLVENILLDTFEVVYRIVDFSLGTDVVKTLMQEELARWLRKLSKGSVIILGFILVSCVGVIDYITGYELGFSIFYLAPILLVTWFSGRWPGILIALLSAVVWLAVDMSTEQHHIHPLIPFWNAGIRFGFFLIIGFLLSMLRIKMVQEQHMATTDHLTGVANRRLFFSLLQTEIQRSRRYNHPFTLVYMDIDDFKSINDHHGHAVGDTILRDVSQVTKNSLRTVDTIARLAGDEFTILLPETDMEATRTVITKIQTSLQSIQEQYDCTVTMSIGAVSFKDAPETVDDAIKIADDLMYTAKIRGKNRVACHEWINRISS